MIASPTRPGPSVSLPLPGPYEKSSLSRTFATLASLLKIIIHQTKRHLKFCMWRNVLFCVTCAFFFFWYRAKRNFINYSFPLLRSVFDVQMAHASFKISYLLRRRKIKYTLVDSESDSSWSLGFGFEISSTKPTDRLSHCNTLIKSFSSRETCWSDSLNIKRKPLQA